ncbi:MAG: hypothetical protein CME62_08365 [Halobacteriovoraceae bacterium]|nr:hypothetical protein [Halobacteriovoraceae bacterium]|tara:strand:+ start:3596 stop:4489 length:894 start_codon:yes stop_codon:yes gene_type:complete
MKILLMLTLSFLVACSSAPKKKQSKKVEDIKQDDFKQIKLVPYDQRDDYFAQVKSKYTEISNTESLGRVYEFDGEVELKGVLGKITQLCYEKEFKTAEILISKNNKSYAKNPMFWNMVGSCYLLQDKRRKALLFYNKALALKANYAPALNNLGVMYMREGDYSRALVAFKKAKSSKEYSRTPRYNLSQLYLNFGLYKQAGQELTTLYSLSRDDIDVLNMLATAYLMSNNIKESLDVYLRVDRDFFEDPKYGINFALAHYFSGNKERAVDVMEDIDKDKLGVWKEYYYDAARHIGADI